MFNPFYAYSFLIGLYTGSYTNLFSKVIISGLVLYMVHPDYFNPQRFTPLYDTINENVSPYISKIYSFDENYENDKKTKLPPLIKNK